MAETARKVPEIKITLAQELPEIQPLTELPMPDLQPRFWNPFPDPLPRNPLDGLDLMYDDLSEAAANVFLFFKFFYL
jgi:hypothetical protein